MTLSPKKGESLRLKNDEKDDEKPPIIIDDGTEIDDIIKGNLNLCQKIDVMNNTNIILCFIHAYITYSYLEIAEVTKKSHEISIKLNNLRTSLENEQGTIPKMQKTASLNSNINNFDPIRQRSTSFLTVSDVNRSRISRSTECLPLMNFDSFDNDYNDLNSCMMLPESTSLDDIVLNSQRAMMRNDQRKRSIFKNRITRHFKDLKDHF